MSFHSLLLRLVSLSNLKMALANSSKRDSNEHEIRRALRSMSAGIRKPHGRGSSKLQLRLLKKFMMILRFAFQNTRLCMNDDAASSQSANDAGHHSVDHIPLLMTSNTQDINSAYVRNLNECNAASKSEYSGRYLTASQEEVLPFTESLIDSTSTSSFYDHLKIHLCSHLQGESASLLQIHGHR